MADIPVNANDAIFTATITSNGQTEVDFDFLTFDADDMRAIHISLTDVRTVLTEGVDFTVSGIEEPNGGTITLMGGAPVTVIGEQVVIYRESVIDRLFDYQKNGDFRAVTVNRELDIVFMIMQELRRDIDRALKPPLGAPALTLPEPEPDSVIGWGDSGELENKIPAAGSILLVPVFSTRAAAALFILTPFDAVRVLRFSTGSHLIDALYVKVGSEPAHSMKFQDLAGNWFEIGPDEALSPYHAGALGLTDDTAIVQEVLNLAQTRGSRFDGSGPDWPVSKINISTGNVFFEIVGNFKVKGVSGAAQTCLIEITRGNFAVSGSITAFCQYLTNYAAGFWIHNDTQIQSADLQEFIAVACLVGIRIGDTAHGASVTSELTLNAPRTYGCPTALMVEGGNTFLTVIGGFPLSADAFGGGGAWAALTKRALINKGASVSMLGGELIQTGSGLATDFLIEMQPCMFNTDIAWGRVTINGTVLETGGPLCTITNPLGLSGTALANDKPAFTVIGGLGFHSQDNSPFIVATAAYPGEIVIEKCNFWFPGTRTQPNISCAGNLCHVYVDDHGFGNGFKGPIAGTSGGLIHFAKRIIFEAIGLPAVALGAGANVLKWQSFVAADDHLRYQGFYSAATGVFTVPTGGLRNMRIRAQAYAAGVTGYMVIRIGGTEVARGPFADAGSVQYEDVNVAAGGAVTVDLVVTAGAGAFPSVSSFLNTFVVEALN